MGRRHATETYGNISFDFDQRKEYRTGSTMINWCIKFLIKKSSDSLYTPIDIYTLCLNMVKMW